MRCPIDDKEMLYSFTETVLAKYSAKYFRCPSCGLVQPENPEKWLGDAYSSAIAATDIGIVRRNMDNIKNIEPILYRLGRNKNKILDVGGGYGMLCRGLRDIGFDCYTKDIYCENLFAKNFEPYSDFKAPILLAFEVLEHVIDPFEFLDEQFKLYSADLIIFSTLTYKSDEAPPRDWWYYTLETGQHVSIYHQKSLEFLAQRLGLHFVSINNGLHVLSKYSFSKIDKFLLLNKYKLPSKLYRSIVRKMRKKESLLSIDYEDAKKKIYNLF